MEENNRSLLDRLVSSRISEMYKALSSDYTGSTIRARMAALRSAAGAHPKDHPAAWVTVAEDVLVGFPDQWRGDEKPTAEESASFSAMCLWALHQQAVSSPMHRSITGSGVDFGRAVGLLAKYSVSSSIKPRFDALVLSTSETQRLVHLRSLVQLLRTYEIALDYGVLAADLLDLNSPETRQGIILKWGRSYATANSHARSKEESA